jgi:DNA-directed RNA polymerase subunit RPC12/RpoP
MKTLEEFNNMRLDWHQRVNDAEKPKPNGISCPECTAELWDTDPRITLTSNPPQKNIHCPECGFRGLRYC